jgi:septum formation protein
LVLASTSRARRELLGRIGIDFVAVSPSFDEATLEGRFAEVDDATFALEIARCKAESLAETHGQHFVLAADQIAVIHDGARVLLHKPGTAARAVAQLMQLSGRTHVLTTAVVLGRPDRGDWTTAVDRQVMTMRAFDEGEARRYVEAFMPVDSVGAYRIEDAGITLFESVEGADFTGIMGLPLLAVCRLLRAARLL